MVRQIMKERFNSPDKRPGDFLDQAINDMASEKFLTEDFIAELAFGILFAAFESVSTTLTLALKFLSENPHVLEELTVTTGTNKLHKIFTVAYKLFFQTWSTIKHSIAHNL